MVPWQYLDSFRPALSAWIMGPGHLGKSTYFWIFIGRTDAEAPILWSPDVKSRLIGKDPETGKDWRQEEKGVTENETVGWHHQLNGHEFAQTQGGREWRTGKPSVLRSMGLQRVDLTSDWTAGLPLSWDMCLGFLTSLQPHSRSSGVNFISLFRSFHHRHWIGYRPTNNQSGEGRGDTHCWFCSGRWMAREATFLRLYSGVWGWKGWSWGSRFATIGDSVELLGTMTWAMRMKLRLEEVCAWILRDQVWWCRLSHKVSFHWSSCSQWGGEGGNPPPTHPGDIWLCLEAFLVVTVWNLLLASGG